MDFMLDLYALHVFFFEWIYIEYCKYDRISRSPPEVVETRDAYHQTAENGHITIEKDGTLDSSTKVLFLAGFQGRIQ